MSNDIAILFRVETLEFKNRWNYVLRTFENGQIQMNGDFDRKVISKSTDFPIFREP